MQYLNHEDQKVFISFRNDDCPLEVDFLQHYLWGVLGSDSRVFCSKDGFKSIEAGNQWADVLREVLPKSRVMLVVIGPKWLSLLRQKQEKIGRENSLSIDWVEEEIKTALDLGKNKCSIIPVLFGNVAMPTADELPDSIKGLTAWQTASLDCSLISGSHGKIDAAHLHLVNMGERWGALCKAILKQLNENNYHGMVSLGQALDSLESFDRQQAWEAIRIQLYQTGDSGRSRPFSVLYYRRSEGFVFRNYVAQKLKRYWLSRNQSNVTPDVIQEPWLIAVSASDMEEEIVAKVASRTQKSVFSMADALEILFGNVVSNEVIFDVSGVNDDESLEVAKQLVETCKRLCAASQYGPPVVVMLQREPLEEKKRSFSIFGNLFTRPSPVEEVQVMDTWCENRDLFNRYIDEWIGSDTEGPFQLETDTRTKETVAMAIKESLKGYPGCPDYRTLERHVMDAFTMAYHDKKSLLEGRTS